MATTPTTAPATTPCCEGLSCEPEITRALALVAGRWAVPVLEAMVFADGPVRFRELQRRIGAISQKELSRQLTSFVHHAVVNRRAIQGPGARVDYVLTPRGRALLGQMDALGRWVRGAATPERA
jgi:DNA-binding HxlR family transcriptional regulator